MNKYELAVVVSAKLEDDARTSVVEKVKSLIARVGGTVTSVDEWGKKLLAYEIQKTNEGYYYFIKFTSKPEAPVALEPEMRIVDGVLRYLILKDEGIEQAAEVAEQPEA